MKTYIKLFILILLIIACHQESNPEKVYEMASVDAELLSVTRQMPGADQTPADGQNTSTDKKKIIKDGRMGIRVEELEKTKTRTDSLVRVNRGYYANENFTNSEYESAFQLKIRMPNTNFERFISAIESGQGEILYKEIDARDVTEEFIDLEVRLENKRNYLARYNEILKQAKSIKEILEVEEKMRILEEEIESAEGRLTYLSDQLAFSTLDLNISKQKKFRFNPAPRDSFMERLKQSLSKGWFGFIDFLLFVLKIWPLWIILSLAWYLWRRYRKKRKSKSHA